MYDGVLCVVGGVEYFQCRQCLNGFLYYFCIVQGVGYDYIGEEQVDMYVVVNYCQCLFCIVGFEYGIVEVVE